MAEQRFPSAPAAELSTRECPLVADLIRFALGQCDGDEHRHIELHLESSASCACQRWVATSSRVGKTAFDAVPVGLPPAAPAAAGRTPIPPSSRWGNRVSRFARPPETSRRRLKTSWLCWTCSKALAASRTLHCARSLPPCSRFADRLNCCAARTHLPRGLATSSCHWSGAGRSHLDALARAPWSRSAALGW